MRTYLTKKELIESIKDLPDDTIVFGANYAGITLPLHSDDFDFGKEKFYHHDLDKDFNGHITFYVEF